MRVRITRALGQFIKDCEYTAQEHGCDENGIIRSIWYWDAAQIRAVGLEART